MSNTAWNGSSQALEEKFSWLLILPQSYSSNMGYAAQCTCPRLLCPKPWSAVHGPSPHWPFLQGVQTLLCSLFKALEVLPPASGWDSKNLMDINYLLALMEDLVCPESATGQGFWEETLEREDPRTSTHGPVHLKGKFFPGSSPLEPGGPGGKSGPGLHLPNTGQHVPAHPASRSFRKLFHFLSYM